VYKYKELKILVFTLFICLFLMYLFPSALLQEYLGFLLPEGGDTLAAVPSKLHVWVKVC
jgi:hypothetical protein